MFKVMVGILIGVALVGAGWWYYSDGGKRDPVDGFTDAVKYQTRQATKAVNDKIDESVDGLKSEVSDATILATIKAKLLKEKSLDGLDINVDVDDGVVTLKGEVPSREALARAILIVRETEGVTRYQTDLRIVVPSENVE